MSDSDTLEAKQKAAGPKIPLPSRPCGFHEFLLQAVPEIQMKKFTVGLSLVAFAAAGTAVAQPGARHGPDADRNGVVTRAEAQAQATRMFAMLDANEDAQLNQDDREARREQRRSRVFETLDANDDGQITRAEFMSFERPGKGSERGKRPRVGRRGDYRAMTLMRMADADNDGTVSQAEYTAGALRRFDRMDADGDQQVTREEREAARKQMREKWRERMRERRAS